MGKVDSLISYLRSWADGIAASFPANLSAALGLGEEFSIIAVTDSKIEVFQYRGRQIVTSSQLTSKQENNVRKQFRGPQLLLIPKEDSMTLSLSVPKSAQRSIDQLLESEIERLTPFKFSEVKATYEIASTEAGQLNIKIHVVPSIKFDALLETATEAGALPEKAVIEPTLNSGHFVGNFLIGDNLPNSSRRFQYAILILILFLGCSAIASPFVQREWSIRKLNETMEQFRPQIEIIQSKRKRLDQIRNEAETITNFIKTSPDILLLLDSVTTILPDTAWLKQYSVKDTELILQGFATDASDVLNALNKVKLLKDPFFKSSIIKEPSNQLERFHIGVKLSP